MDRSQGIRIDVFHCARCCAVVAELNTSAAAVAALPPPHGRARGLLQRAAVAIEVAPQLYCYCLDGGHYEDTRERALRGGRRHPRRRYCIELSLFVGQGFANLPGFCGAGTRG